MKTYLFIISILLVSVSVKSQTEFLNRIEEEEVRNWDIGGNFINHWYYSSTINKLSKIADEGGWEMSDDNNNLSNDNMAFVADTIDNPRETFYILTDGSIIDGVEFKKRVIDSWNEAFGNLNEEEKDLFSNINFTMSFDTLNKK